MSIDGNALLSKRAGLGDGVSADEEQASAARTPNCVIFCARHFVLGDRWAHRRRIYPCVARQAATRARADAAGLRSTTCSSTATAAATTTAAAAASPFSGTAITAAPTVVRAGATTARRVVHATVARTRSGTRTRADSGANTPRSHGYRGRWSRRRGAGCGDRRSSVSSRPAASRTQRRGRMEGSVHGTRAHCAIARGSTEAAARRAGAVQVHRDAACSGGGARAPAS